MLYFCLYVAGTVIEKTLRTDAAMWFRFAVPMWSPWTIKSCITALMRSSDVEMYS